MVRDCWPPARHPQMSELPVTRPQTLGVAACEMLERSSYRWDGSTETTCVTTNRMQHPM